MKKLVTILALCLALSSCDSKPITHDELQRRRDREIAARISKFNYEGHSYLLYRYGAHGCGVCHDENCPCKKSIPTE